MLKCLTYWPPVDSAASLAIACAFFIIGLLVGIYVKGKLTV